MSKFMLRSARKYFSYMKNFDIFNGQQQPLDRKMERYTSFQIGSTKSKYDQLYHTFRFLPVNKEDIVTSGCEQEVKAGDKR